MVFCDLEGQLARASDMRFFTSGYSPPVYGISLRE